MAFAGKLNYVAICSEDKSSKLQNEEDNSSKLLNEEDNSNKEEIAKGIFLNKQKQTRDIKSITTALQILS